MTQQRKRRPKSNEPKELGPEPADIGGKEPVLVKDWDKEAIINAMMAKGGGQRDIIEGELDYLTEPGTPRAETWSRRAQQPFGHHFSDVPADIVERMIAKCRLDGIPMIVEEPEVDFEEQIETRFHEAVEHVVTVTPAQVEAARLLKERGKASSAAQKIAEAEDTLTPAERQKLYYKDLP